MVRLLLLFPCLSGGIWVLLSRRSSLGKTFFALQLVTSFILLVLEMVFLLFAFIMIMLSLQKPSLHQFFLGSLLLF